MVRGLEAGWAAWELPFWDPAMAPALGSNLVRVPARELDWVDEVP